MSDKASESEEEKLKCKLCGSLSFTEEEHQAHMKLHKLKFECKICKTPFHNIRSRTQHYYKNHKESTLDCESCKITYRKIRDTDKHKKYHAKDLPYLCLVCLKSFKRFKSLKDHHLQHVTNVEAEANKIEKVSSRIFKCDNCGKEFDSRKKITAHVRESHGNKKTMPNLCHICGKAFSDSKALSRHRRYYHVPPGIFPCKLCGKILEHNVKLKIHMDQHRRENKTGIKRQRPAIKLDLPLPPPPCEFCDKIFNNYPSLFRHRKIHLNSYTCATCGKKFNKLGNLRTHEVIHTGRKPYSCSCCGKSYSDRSNIMKHIVKHPPELDAKIIRKK